ncbi:hypothetical protein [Massilia sp. Mn16-1_5]|uniref:hypothetical protein n=1 Tax=Massilia sp. Mn16-1_5 TaxID=2079199 RepID=UPI00109E9C08|nr:hypothetical protein [Massilia sp. Mn16-1_5]
MGRSFLGFVAIGIAGFATIASAETSIAGFKPALETESIGLLPADGFRLRTGNCPACAVPKQNLWYFQNELIAVPANGAAASGFSRGVDRNTDVVRWAVTTESAQLAHPSVVWIGSPGILEGATVLPGAQTLRTADGQEIGLKLVPQLPTNRSYANDATAAWLAGRQVRMRGALEDVNGRPTIIARMIWPSDFAIEPATLKTEPLKHPSGLTDFVRASAGEGKSVDTRLLWERHPGQERAWKDKPVLGIVLNGAQGDDDESLGGHFAVATGRFGDKGDWSSWAVNNFYNLDSVSEKGILAATVPMDNYLMDLNSGQQYYRPSVMLVAILNNARTAIAYQGGIQRVFNHFYRHDFRYRHAAANCTGISVDVVDALGWHIPKRGPTAPLKSIGAYGYVAATDGSLASGRKIYDYLNEEQIRLLPAVGFDAIGQDLLQLVATEGMPKRPLSRYEQQLREDVEAILLVRIPQVPSSRAMGSAPVFSFDEFRSRVPADQADWKIVPVGARPFPAALRDADLTPDEDPSVVPLPVAGIGVGIGAILAGVVWRRRARPAGKARPVQRAPETADAE